MSAKSRWRAGLSESRLDKRSSETSWQYTEGLESLTISYAARRWVAEYAIFVKVGVVICLRCERGRKLLEKRGVMDGLNIHVVEDLWRGEDPTSQLSVGDF